MKVSHGKVKDGNSSEQIHFTLVEAYYKFHNLKTTNKLLPPAI
jgi:hypothetical protein